MNLVTSPLFSLLLVLSLISPSAQQSSVAGSPRQQDEPKLDANPTSQEKSTTSKQHALVLLGELISQTNNFAPGLFKMLRVSLVQADIADLLWEYDQPRARSLFETALKSAETMRPKANGGRAQSSPMTTYHLQVEKEILECVLSRDTRFAEELAAVALKASKAASTNATEPDWAFRSEQAILFSLIARSVAAADPQHAASLVRTSFNGWFGPDQVLALNSLRLHAPKLSDQIFLDALTVLKEKPTNVSNKVAILAPYAFPDISTETNFYIKKASGSPNQPDASPAVRKSFLEFVYDTLMQLPVASQTAETSGFGTASFDSFTMRELLSRFDQDLPNKAPAIRARVKEIINSIKKTGRQDFLDADSEAWARSFRANVQALIAKAEAAKEQTEKDDLYTEAAGLLFYRDGSVEQALSLLAKVSDGTTKTHLIATIREALAGGAIDSGDAEKAYLYCKEVQDIERRGDLLIQIAELLIRKNNRKRAKVVWEEAHQIAKAVEQESVRPYQMLKLAAVAAEIDPALGFETMKETIEVINGAATSIGTDLSSGAGVKIQFFGRFDFDETFDLLAGADFERALQLAKSIKPSELSTLAQFSACKAVLRKPTELPIKAK